MEKLLDLKAVAEILGIAPVTAKIWASKRRFPVVKVGRLVRVAPEALDEWIRENTYQQPPCAPNRPSRVLKRPKTRHFEGFLDELRSEGAGRGRT